jgi:hypothetical protein
MTEFSLGENSQGTRRDKASFHRTVTLIVHLACATLLAKAQRKEGTFGTLRLSPIARKLHELTANERNEPLK